MSMFAKIMVVVNFILAVAFLAAAGTLLGAAEDYKAKFEKRDVDAKSDHDILNKQAEVASQRAADSEGRFKTAEQQRAVSESAMKQLKDNNEQALATIAQVKADLDKFANNQQDLQGKLGDLNKQVDGTRGELAASEAARKEADAKNKAQADEIARLSQDKDTAEKALAAAAANEKTLAERVDSQATTLARYKAEKGDLNGGMTMQPVHGVVNAADNKVDICIISVGTKDKVEVGYESQWETLYDGPAKDFDPKAAQETANSQST